jgi:hypothetical protein
VVDNEAGVEVWDLAHLALGRDHVDERLTGVARGEHLELRYSWPGSALGIECLHAGGSYQAAVDRLDLVASVPSQPDGARIVNTEPDSGAPTEAIWRAGKLLDLDCYVHAGETVQLLGDECGLQAPLLGE